jgi:hypothetical protein
MIAHRANKSAPAAGGSVNGQRLSGPQGASASRPSGEWNDDDYDVLAEGVVVGRVMKAAASPAGTPWLWTLAYGDHEDRTPTHGDMRQRQAAILAFAMSCGGSERLS